MWLNKSETLKKFPVQAVMGSILDKKYFKKVLLYDNFHTPWLVRVTIMTTYKNMILKAIRGEGKLAWLNLVQK